MGKNVLLEICVNLGVLDSSELLCFEGLENLRKKFFGFFKVSVL